MYTLLIILIVIAAVLMIGIVLIQESKGGGLASNFSTYNQIGGVRKTTDFIEKTTWGLAVAMVVISIFCAYVAPQASTDGSVMEGIENRRPTPTTCLVSVPASRRAQPLPSRRLRLSRLRPLPLRKLNKTSEH